MRAYLRLALFFYYKKIEINYKEPLCPGQARLFLGNHQNGLMDPLLIATKSGQFSYFLTRASVFKKAWVSSFLKNLLMLPVYRIRDGMEQLSKNEAVFKTCSQLLSDKNAIVLFPEGSHNIKRTIRPLSKGFTRIMATTLNNHPQVDLQLVPVGFNYRCPEDFGDEVLLNFGAPLKSKNYMPLHSNASIMRVKRDVHGALTTLTTHIDSEDYTLNFQKLKRLKVDFLNPDAVNHCLATHFKDCEMPSEKNNHVLKAVAKMGLIICLWLPYGIWKLIVQPKIKEPEFTATFRFALVISLVPLFILAMATVIGLYLGVWYALLYVLLVVALDILAVKL